MPSDELRLEPALSEIGRLIEWVEARCAADDVGPEITMKMALALEEAVANAINHGLAGAPPPHRIAVRLEVTADRVAAEIIDNGRPFDPTAMPEPDLSAGLEQREPGGLGIHLMRSLMDGMEYRRSEDCNILRMHKALG